MRSTAKKSANPRWYQLPVSEAINQGLTFVLSALLSVSLNFWGLIKTLEWKNPVALALTILVPTAVFVWHKLAMVGVAERQPSHLNEIVDDLLSIRIPTGKVVPNHANTKLLYVKYTVKDTWAVYMLDIASKQTSLVREVIGDKGATEHSADMTVSILGWSPHDEYFAYLRGWGRREVVICDGTSGREFGKGQLKRGLTGSTWLNARALLCSDGEQIVNFSPDAKGWKKSLFYETPQIREEPKSQKSKKHFVVNSPVNRSLLVNTNDLPVGNIKSLAAYGLDSAVWQQSNAIYVREQGRELNTIWRTTNYTLVEFSFLPSAGKFLLHCKDDAGDFLTEYYPRAIWGKDAYTNIVRLETGGDYVPTEAQFINGGKGYAYLNSSEIGQSELVVRPERTKPPVELPWENEIRGFYINGFELYGITANDTEPPGIWACDFRTLIPKCLVSSIERPFKYAENVPVMQGYVTNASGERLTYYLLQPTRFDRNRKYPLVVGNLGAGDGNTWDRMSQTIANCGGYFLWMERRKRNPRFWADDALCATKYLMKHYAVDTNNLYLLGVSAGSYTATSLLDSNPELWKGAFIFSMKQYPPVEGMQIRSLVLDVGGLDVKNIEAKLVQFRDDLAANGIRPTLMIHPNTGHYVRSTKLERERMNQMVAFMRQP